MSVHTANGCRFSGYLVGMFVAAGLSLSLPARAAESPNSFRTGRFVASCDDLGHICFADTCGRDQIEAALACRAQCPASVVRHVTPAICAMPTPLTAVILRRRG